MLKENTHSTLLMIQKDEAASCIEEAATQAFKVETEKESSGEESDGGGMELDYEDDKKAVVLPDEDEEANQTADDDIVKVGEHVQVAQAPVSGDINDEEVTNTQETTDEGINDKKPTGPQDGTVSHDPEVLAAGRIAKSTLDHLSVQVVQRIMRVHLLTFSELIGIEGLSSMFFQLTVTCRDGSVAHGDEFLDNQWMLDTSLHSATL